MCTSSASCVAFVRVNRPNPMSLSSRTWWWWWCCGWMHDICIPGHLPQDPIITQSRVFPGKSHNCTNSPFSFPLPLSSFFSISRPPPSLHFAPVLIFSPPFPFYFIFLSLFPIRLFFFPFFSLFSFLSSPKIHPGCLGSAVSSPSGYRGVASHCCKS